MALRIASSRSLLDCSRGTVKYAVVSNSALDDDGFNGLQGALELEASTGAVSNVNDDVRYLRPGVPADEQCELPTDFEMTMHARLTPDTEPAQRSLTMTAWLLARNQTTAHAMFPKCGAHL